MLPMQNSAGSFRTAMMLSNDMWKSQPRLNARVAVNLFAQLRQRRLVRFPVVLNSSLECGVATMWVMPSAAAIRHISTAISHDFAPSSTDGRMWL